MEFVNNALFADIQFVLDDGQAPIFAHRVRKRDKGTKSMDSDTERTQRLTD